MYDVGQPLWAFLKNVHMDACFICVWAQVFMWVDIGLHVYGCACVWVWVYMCMGVGLHVCGFGLHACGCMFIEATQNSLMQASPASV